MNGNDSGKCFIVYICIMNRAGRIIWHNELASTNLEVVKEFKTLVSGDIVATRKQSYGKGLGENSWVSEPGKNLTFSYFLKPERIEAASQYVINMAVAKAVRSFLEDKLNMKVHVKWPNDILVDEKKICGVLIQHALMGSEILYSVIGVGLNVNQVDFPDFAREATSMSLIFGETYNLEILLKELSTELSSAFQNLDKKEDLKTDYLKHLYRNGEWHKYVLRGDEIKGCIIDINETGLLLLKDEEGQVHACDLKELVYLD